MKKGLELLVLSTVVQISLSLIHEQLFLCLFLFEVNALGMEGGWD